MMLGPERRRVNIDLIRCYKIVLGLFDLNCDEVFFNSVSHTLADTGHPYILYKILIELTLVCHF